MFDMKESKVHRTTEKSKLKHFKFSTKQHLAWFKQVTDSIHCNQ